MTEILRNWIINIVFTLFLIVIIEILVPGEKFQKYLKFATGLLLIIVIINPISQIYNKTKTLESISVGSFSSSQSFERNDFDAVRNTQILSLYKEKLRTQVKEEVLVFENINDAYIDVVVNEHEKDEAFGQIQSMKVVLYSPSEGDELADKVRNKISNTYKVPKENIFIKIQKVG